MKYTQEEVLEAVTKAVGQMTLDNVKEVLIDYEVTYLLNTTSPSRLDGYMKAYGDRRLTAEETNALNKAAEMSTKLVSTGEVRND